MHVSGSFVLAQIVEKKKEFLFIHSCTLKKVCHTPLEKGALIHPLKKEVCNGQETQGFHLEKALRVPKKVPKKTVGSALATALLSLWCHGKVSGTTMRWLAESALLDGAQHDELVKIAKCGSHGLHPGNIHRDLMATFCKGLDMPTPFELEKVPCKNSRP